MLNKRQNLGLLCAALLLGAGLHGCGAETTEDTEEDATSGTVNEKGVNESDVRTAVPDLGALLIDLPSSLAISSGSGSLRLQEDEGGGPESLVMIPGRMIGIAEDMNEMIQEITWHLFGKADCRDDDASNDPSDCSDYPGIVRGAITTTPTIFEIPEDPDDPGAPSFVKYFKNAAGSEYDYTFEMYWTNATDGLHYQGMELKVTKTAEDQGKGVLTFASSVMPDDGEGGGPEAVVTSFDNTSGSATMSVAMYGMADASDPDQPDRLAIELSLSEAGLLTGSGAVIRGELETATGSFAPFETAPEFAWVFTVAANTSEDVAVQNMAFPQADNFDDSANFFDNYGLDSIFSNFVIGFLRNDGDDWQCGNANANNFLFGINDSICASNTAVSDAAVISGFQDFCADSANSDNGLCSSGLLGYTQWSNPIYLNAEGYVGNEVSGKPSDAAYDGLATALADVTLYEPATLKAAEVPSLNDGEGIATVE